MRHRYKNGCLNQNAPYKPDVTVCLKPDDKKKDVTQPQSSKTVCQFKCPDRRQDPHFIGKNDKPHLSWAQDNRLFQATCFCQKHSPNYCGWKTTGAGTKAFAGGNIECRWTKFVTKPVLRPGHIATDDLEILENYALDKINKNNGKVKYAFNSDNFVVEYVHETQIVDSKGKKKKAYVPMDPSQHTYWDDKLQMNLFPTDLMIGDNKKAVNVRAIIRCQSHPADRQFFTLQPYCKNPRHKLKKGRPGECYWRIYEVQPNPESSYNDTPLGFDPDVKVPKAQKLTGKMQNLGLKGVSGSKVVGALQGGNRAWRCPDFAEKRLR